jgi:hypothetical protein
MKQYDKLTQEYIDRLNGCVRYCILIDGVERRVLANEIDVNENFIYWKDNGEIVFTVNRYSSFYYTIHSQDWLANEYEANMRIAARQVEYLEKMEKKRNKSFIKKIFGL